MLIKQIAVFLENRYGRLNELATVLAKEKIDMLTMTIADTQDFGIVRIITTDNEKAIKVLKNDGFTVTETSLIGIEVNDVPGALSKVLSVLSENKIDIEYLYSYARRENHNAIILIKVQEVSKALEILADNGVRVLDHALS